MTSTNASQYARTTTTKTTRSLLAALIGLALFVQSVHCGAELSVDIQHNGLQGPSGSQVHFDDRNGLALRGTISDILGPPIKIANGFNNMFHGSNMAGVGHSLRQGAVVGIDSKLLEAAGGASMLKGGLLLGGSAAKTAAAAKLGGAPGKKIASIIEVPVKVVAMADLAAGKAMEGMAQAKQTEQQNNQVKGQNMIQEGDALKRQGMNQVMEGASEGVQNFGNMVQKTAENAATAFKLLPIILDLPTGANNKQQSSSSQHHTQQLDDTKSPYQHAQSDPASHQMQAPGSLTGGSLFGGLSSLLPGLGNSDPLGLQAMSGQASGPNRNRNPFASLFGAAEPNPGYAALINSTSPIANLLMHPAANPFLLPIAGGPLGQALGQKLPIGTEASAAGHHPGGTQSATFNYNLFPGIRMSETMSSSLPQNPFANKFGTGAHHAPQAAQVAQASKAPEQPQPQQQQQQQQIEQTKGEIKS